MTESSAVTNHEAFTTVVVPVDGTDLSATALHVAAEIASLVEADLRVLAYTKPSDKQALFLPVSDQAASVGRKYRIKPYLTIEPMTQFVADHVLAEVAAHPPALVCMASHGRDRSAAYFGSVAAEVLTVHEGPVLLVGPSFDSEHHHVADRGPIIVAVDGSEYGESVLAIAEEWSVRFGLPLEVVTVLEPKVPAEAAAVLASGDVLESGYVHRTAATTGAVTAEIAQFEVLHDAHPAHALVEEARLRNASMIAMATHAPRGIERLRKGSVTAEVIRHSTVPVLAIHPVD